jgi:5-methylcytosine-specific restriction protein A
MFDQVIGRSNTRTITDMELGDLERAIDGVDVGADAESVAIAFRLLDRLAAKCHVALGKLTAEDVWAAQGSTSVAAFLRAHAGMTASDGGRASRTARLVARAPELGHDWGEGNLSGAQVAVVRANVRPEAEHLFAEHAPDLVPTLVGLTVAETQTVMRVWRARADALLEGVAPDEPPLGALHHHQLLDGSWRLDADLSTEAGAIVAGALARAADRVDAVGDEPRSHAARQAEALVEICAHFLTHGASGATRRRRPHLHVVLHADGDGYGHLLDGGVLTPSATRRLACDAAVHRVVLGGRSELLDLGRATRVVSPGLFTALSLRDGGCRHPGCDRPVDWCDAHHVVPVADGGPTSLANLVLKCRRHHTLAHQPGWHERLAPDGTLHVVDPAGRTHTSHPPGPPGTPGGDRWWRSPDGTVHTATIDLVGTDA